MKSLFKYLMLLSITLLVFSGCKKDDDQSNFVRVDNEQFSLASGVLVKFGMIGDEAEGCYYALTLVSPDIEVGQYGSLSGTGAFINFFIVSESLTGLPSGTYTFDETSIPLPFSTFGDAAHCMTWQSGHFNDMADIISGEITVVNHDNDRYEITFNCKDENNDRVEGYFNGTLLLCKGQLAKK